MSFSERLGTRKEELIVHYGKIYSEKEENWDILCATYFYVFVVRFPSWSHTGGELCGGRVPNLFYCLILSTCPIIYPKLI